MTVMIVDYGMGNLGSALRSLEICGADAMISSNPADLQKASGIVVPGVGSFGDGMENLRRGGWVEALRAEALGNHIPCLGICLGMQLLADSSMEGKADGETPHEGLGLIHGKVIKLVPHDSSEKIPHVGWNEVNRKTSHTILNDIDDHKDFYFVHSYHFVAYSQDDVIATTPYCGKFTSVIASGSITGVQFHPEKSQLAGFRLLRNFLQQC